MKTKLHIDFYFEYILTHAQVKCISCFVYSLKLNS